MTGKTFLRVRSLLLALCLLVRGSVYAQQAPAPQLRPGPALPGVLISSYKNDLVLPGSNPTPTSCAAACDANSAGCVAWTISPDNGKAACHLKTTIYSIKANACCTSGVAVRPPVGDMSGLWMVSWGAMTPQRVQVTQTGSTVQFGSSNYSPGFSAVMSGNFLYWGAVYAGVRSDASIGSDLNVVSASDGGVFTKVVPPAPPPPPAWMNIKFINLAQFPVHFTITYTLRGAQKVQDTLNPGFTVTYPIDAGATNINVAADYKTGMLLAPTKLIFSQLVDFTANKCFEISSTGPLAKWNSNCQ